ncbi:MAG: phage Gp37/Gp68 family protein, partial [Hyphomonas sp.]|nr:phage Gp37/Gp68 family protein [Hyphomonas sp.]
MGEGTKIEWADFTFNPFIGCTKVSPACDNCYAEAQANRYWKDEGLWAGNRKRTSENNWRNPLKWNRQAAAFRAQHGRPPMVFCASLADVFDNQVPDEWRRDLWELIAATPDLIWLLLTKRPQNIAKMLPHPGLHFPRGGPAWGGGWPNVWLGTTVENQAEADRRIPALLSVPAAKRFLSCEPLLGPVDLGRIPVSAQIADGDEFRDAEVNCLSGGMIVTRPAIDALVASPAKIDWVIAGGESGREARPSHPDWFRSLRDQCAAA